MISFNAIEKRKIIFFLSFFISISSLFASFQFNAFCAAEQSWFANYQFDSEALVIGRLAKSEQSGLFSNGGMLGKYTDIPGEINQSQTDLFSGKTNGQSFDNYTSQIGAQGIFFSIIDFVITRLSYLSGQEKIEIYHAINSLITAVVLSCVILLYLSELGVIAAISVLITIICSQWLIIFGKNLYWVVWAMYLPMLAVFFLHKKEEKSGLFDKKLAFLTTSILVGIKSSAGYEYVSTLMLSGLTPMVYFSIKNQWSKRFFVNRLILLSSASVVGFIVINIVHVMQIAATYDIGFIDALVGRLHHAQSRMYVPKGTFGGISAWETATTASVFEVINKYWNGEAFNLHNIFGFNYFKIITFSDLFLVFVCFSCIGLISEKYIPNININRNKIVALIVTTWFSLAAPMSWFILAKVHSYVHTHINHVLWHIPFTIWAFALVGYLLSLIFSGFFKDKKIISLTVVVICLVLLIPFIQSNIKRNKYYAEVLNETRSNSLYSFQTNNGFTISYINSNKLSYYHPDCNKINLGTRFFLHIYPKKQDINNMQEDFKNSDFYWVSHEIKKSTFLNFNDNSCLAIVNLPDFSIKGIRTGQYTSNGSRVWQDYIDYQSIVQTSNISAYNLSDNQWTNGISLDGKSFFIENTAPNKQSISIGDILFFPDNIQREITNITYSTKYINIFVSGRKLHPKDDGFPKKIKILHK